MVRVKLVPKRTKIRVWPPKEPYQKFKIKVLLPEQKTIQINKNGQPVSTLMVRREIIKFADHWDKQFFKKMLAPNWEDHYAKTC